VVKSLCPPAKRTSGFTLIELLIVVAIIAILAAIAVPNFLEAQVRSKVSRAKSDMRTITTALESYYIDANKYPACYEQHAQVRWSAPYSEPPFHSRVPSLLTTPVAYLTSLPDDPFKVGKIPPNVANDAQLRFMPARFVYFNWAHMRALFPSSFSSSTNFGNAERLSGAWLFYSVGPDADEFNRSSNAEPLVGRKVYVDYDPTNGTVSTGNIFRTAKSGERLGADPFFNQ